MTDDPGPYSNLTDVQDHPGQQGSLASTDVEMMGGDAPGSSIKTKLPAT
jgi:hypothetical protein